MSEFPPPPQGISCPWMRSFTSSIIVCQDDGFTIIKEETGLHDPAELKKHIMTLQAKAYARYPYPCIREFDFARTRISGLPAYPEALKLGREREGAILLEFGSCCGCDIRKAVRDGFPIQNLIASDITRDFWEMGHELWRSTPETFPATFLVGDLLDSEFIESAPPLTTTEIALPAPPLSSLTSLTPMRGHISVIHISFVFQLFAEAQQILLSPLPGSIILGSHAGQRSKGPREGGYGNGRFTHSPESWREMWETVFPSGTIKVDVVMKRRSFDSENVGVMMWSVSRL
ncbi:hypothetical protein B0H19DRAFT_1287613 [Mycena capillaripes]|nr:hypothetical protein B0H19DRAFT_1287613 [Mycena capillaripes]